MNKRHLVDSLSLSRIIFGILFACSVFYLNGNLIIIFVIYFFAVLSDVLDGKLARRYKIVKLFCIVLCKFTAVLVFDYNNPEINGVFQNKL